MVEMEWKTKADNLFASQIFSKVAENLDSQYKMMVNGNLKWLQTHWKKSIEVVDATIVLLNAMKS